MPNMNYSGANRHNESHQIIRTHDDQAIGLVSVIMGPAGVCEVRLILDNDTFVLSELSYPEGSIPNSNETYVQLTGSCRHQPPPPEATIQTDRFEPRLIDGWSESDLHPRP